MGWRDSLFLLVSVIASVTGQFFMKRGAAKIGVATLGSLIQRILSIATTPDLLLGLGAYAIGAIAWILLLTRVPLSVAAPAGSLVYVLSVVIGRYAFNEPVPTTRVIGLLLIVVGVTLVAQRAAGAPVGG